MALKQDRTSSTEGAARIRERGHIYFFYRPKVGASVVRGLDDVERLYMVMSPRGKASYRLIVIGQKRLPAQTVEDRAAWAFVERVSSQPDEVEDELDPKRYLTKTRGERERPPARPAGEGVYVIVRHRNHTHLAYVLELPSKPGEVQQALHIAEEASYVVSIRNPKAAAPPGTGLDKAHRAIFPKGLEKHFRSRRFIPLDPPDFLDHVGAEIVLVGPHQDVVAELGVKPDRQHETEDAAEIFTDLRLEKSMHPTAPLLEGKWA